MASSTVRMWCLLTCFALLTACDRGYVLYLINQTSSRLDVQMWPEQHGRSKTGDPDTTADSKTIALWPGDSLIISQGVGGPTEKYLDLDSMTLTSPATSPRSLSRADVMHMIDKKRKVLLHGYIYTLRWK